MALSRICLLLVQTARSRVALPVVIMSPRKTNAIPALCNFSACPHRIQRSLYRLTHTDSGSNDDIKSNIVSSISENTTSVSVNSLLYHRISFYRMLDLLLELGFKDCEIVDLFVSKPELLHYEAAVLGNALRVLRGEGFSVRQTILILKQSRDIITSIDNVADIIVFLRDVLVLPDGNLQDVLTSNQELLSVPGHVLHTNYNMLMDVFRRSDIVRMVRRHPRILLQSEAEVEAKVNYVNHKMGLDQNDMVWASILSHPLQHIRMRHQCLVRTGCFEKPDKKGATRKPNPYLKEILGGTDKAFAKMAGVTLEELEVLGRLLEVERDHMLEEFEEQLSQYEDEDGEGVEIRGYVRERALKERMSKKVID